MGLTSWKNSPQGKIRRKDIFVAKNYLDKEELDNLNRIVSMYLDYAEMQAKNKKIMYMEDWIKKLDAFLKFNEKEILNDPGKISAEIAKEFVETEFEKYRITQDKLFESDFDILVEKSNKLIKDK